MEALCDPDRRPSSLRLDFSRIPRVTRDYAIEAVKHLSGITSLDVTITEASHHAMILAMNRIAGLGLSGLNKFVISGLSAVYRHSELLESFIHILRSNKDALESIELDVDAAVPLHASLAVQFSRALEACQRVTSVRLYCTSSEWHEEESLLQAIGRMPSVR